MSKNRALHASCFQFCIENISQASSFISTFDIKIFILQLFSELIDIVDHQICMRSGFNGGEDSIFATEFGLHSAQGETVLVDIHSDFNYSCHVTSECMR